MPPNYKRSDVVVLVAQTLSWTAAALVGSSLLQQSPPITIAILVIGVIGTSAVTIWQLNQANRSVTKEFDRLRSELGQKNRELCEANILTLLQQLTRLVGRDAFLTRSCVFLVAKNDERMHIVYHYNMTHQPDFNISLEKHQGCTGHAWGTGDQTFADLGRISESDLSRTWKLTPEQIATTKHVKSILSTPIRYPGGDTIVGILSVDSSAALPESGFNDDETMDIALQSAEAVARLLKMGEIVPNGT